MPTADENVWEKYLEKHPEAKEFHKKSLAHYKQLHEVFSGSVATGKHAFSSIVENNDEEEEEDDGVSDMDGKVAMINSNSDAVVEDRPPRLLSSLSKDTKENSVKSDVCVTAGEASKRKR